MLVVARFAKAKYCKNSEKSLKPWHVGTHLRVLSESYLMTTNMSGFTCFSKIFAFLDKSSLSIGRVNSLVQNTLFFIVSGCFVNTGELA